MPGAGADHDHRCAAVLRAAGNAVSAAGTPARRRAVGQERRAHPAALTAVRAAVAHHRDRQLHLVRADQRARRDRVVARSQPHQHLLPLRGIGANGELLARRRARCGSPATCSSLCCGARSALAAAALSLLLGDEPQQVGRHSADVIGEVRASRSAARSPSTSTICHRAVRWPPARRRRQRDLWWRTPPASRRPHS